jgi:glutathione S-transferase
MAARFTLHGIWASGPTYKVGLMLALSGEPFDYVHVDLRQGEHKRPDYLAKQRFGQVPLLVDNSNGRRLCQSASILEYLADKTGRFGGATLDERIAAREWIPWGWDRVARGVYRTRGIKAGFLQAAPEVLAHYEGEGRAALQALDGYLAGRLWLVGEGPTIAAIDLYGIVAYAPQAGLDLGPYPNVSAWMKRLEALPGFAGPEELLPKETRAVA